MNFLVYLYLLCTYAVSWGCTDSGICISIRPILAYFDGIGIGQVHYTSTNSVVCAILSMKYFFQSYQTRNNDEKLTMTANSIVFPCIGTGICT